MNEDIPETPYTRVEAYLAAMNGEEVGELPEPVTRIEQYLYNLAQGGGLMPVIIYAEGHATVKGYEVPTLTDEQITNAYNGVVAGKEVIVIDDLDTIAIKVLDASNIDDISIRLLFTDKLILTYKVGGTIESQYIVTSTEAKNIDVLTQAEYDAIVTKDANTLYFVKGE